MKFITENEIETKNIAESLAASLKGGEVILLNGELGAGKTTFTKGLVRGLGSNATVVSPTFTIMHGYTDGRISVYHFDMYRITFEEELYELGLEEYMYENAVCVIEWNKFTKLPENVININIKSLGGDRREVEICGR